MKLAYSFNNAITDLNTTTPNDLTANGGAVATNADSPFGGLADGTISSTQDFAIVAKVTASTITVNVAEGCTIPTSGGIASASYSNQRSPFGFPGQKGKWTLNYLAKVSLTQSSPVAGTWYNMTTTTGVSGGTVLSFPVGEWVASYQTHAACVNSTNVAAFYLTLSTGSTTETDKDFTSRCVTPAASVNSFETTTTRSKSVSVSAATPYYLNIQSITASAASMNFSGTVATTVISAENAWV